MRIRYLEDRITRGYEKEGGGGGRGRLVSWCCDFIRDGGGEGEAEEVAREGEGKGRTGGPRARERAPPPPPPPPPIVETTKIAAVEGRSQLMHGILDDELKWRLLEAIKNGFDPFLPILHWLLACF